MALSRTYTASSATVTAGTSFTFSDLSIGTADSTRIVVAYFFARTGGAAATSFVVTIGGVTATVVQSQTSAGNLAVIAYAAVPSGTTATFVVTLNQSYLRSAIYAYSVIDGEYLASGTTIAQTTSTQTIAATTATTGVALFGSYVQSGSVSPIWTVSTADHSIIQASLSHGVASRTTSTETVNETVNWGTSVTKQTLYISFRERSGTPPLGPGTPPNTFGKTTAGTAAAYSYTSGARISLSRFQAPSNGVMKKIFARLRISSAGSLGVRGVIYSDASGSPQTLLASSADSTVTSTTAEWKELPLVGANQITMTAGIYYWIGAHFESGSGVTMNVDSDRAVANTAAISDTVVAFGSSSPATISSTFVNGPSAFYVEYGAGVIAITPPSGMAAWYKADGIDPITDGNSVTFWPDSSGNGYDLTPSGSATGALYRTNGINNIPTVEFTGASATTMASNLSTSVNNITMFTVVRPDDTTGNRNIIDANNTGGVGLRQSSTGYAMVVRAVQASSILANGTIAAGEAAIITAAWDATTNYGYKNGSLGSSNAYTPAITAGRTFILGGGTSFWDGYISEVIIYHRQLTTQERATVHSYFQNKYNILVSDYAAGTVSGQMKVYDGSAFVPKPVKVWNGTAWVVKPLKRWNGTSWVSTNY